MDQVEHTGSLLCYELPDCLVEIVYYVGVFVVRWFVLLKGNVFQLVVEDSCLLLGVEGV